VFAEERFRAVLLYSAAQNKSFRNPTEYPDADARKPCLNRSVKFADKKHEACSIAGLALEGL
jgi:hypothetical protein